MKYNLKSADVLNEADRFEQILNWTLFTSEQDRMLWGYNPKIEWTPGLPMYRDPRAIDPDEWRSEFGDWEYDSQDEENPNYWQGPWGNCARPMYELYEDGNEHWPQMCDPCQVSWRGGITCWNCGTDYPEFEGTSAAMEYKPFEFRFLSPRVDLDRNEVTFTVDVDIMAALRRQQEIMNRTMESMTRSFQRLSNTWRERYDEIFNVNDGHHIHLEWSASAMPEPLEWVPAPRADDHICGARPVFTIIDEAEPFFTESVVVNGIALPENWAELRADVPLPERPGRDFTQWSERTYGPPTTQSRRRS